jgi:hypothetical protein
MTDGPTPNLQWLLFRGRPRLEGLAVLTGTETLSLWHWPTARRLADFGDLRHASAGWVRWCGGAHAGIGPAVCVCAVLEGPTVVREGLGSG